MSEILLKIVEIAVNPINQQYLLLIMLRRPQNQQNLLPTYMLIYSSKLTKREKRDASTPTCHIYVAITLLPLPMGFMFRNWFDTLVPLPRIRIL